MENKERLEEIEKLAVMIMTTECEEEYDSLVNVFILKHLERLIRHAKEQTGRVQELESDKEEMYKLNQELGRKAWGIEQQNKQYREAIKGAFNEFKYGDAYNAELILVEALEESE